MMKRVKVKGHIRLRRVRNGKRQKKRIKQINKKAPRRVKRTKNTRKNQRNANKNRRRKRKPKNYPHNHKKPLTSTPKKTLPTPINNNNKRNQPNNKTSTNFARN
jgi:hypothetical protein